MRTTLFWLIALSLVLLNLIRVPITAVNAERAAQEAPQLLGLPLHWPEDLSAADPAVAERIIFAAADRLELNVFRTSYVSDPEGRATITHYLYLGSERTEVFESFSLREGRWPTPDETRNGSARVTTTPRDDRSIGSPRVFANAFELTFAPLSQAFTALPTTGGYVIETIDSSAHQRFLRLVLDDLARLGIRHLSIHDLGTAPPSPRLAVPDWTRSLPFGVAAVTSVLAIALVVRTSKSVGVLVLLGHSAFRIWTDTVGRALGRAVCIGLLGAIAVTLLVPHTTATFLGVSLGLTAGIALLTLGLSLGASFLLTRRTSTTELITGSLR